MFRNLRRRRRNRSPWRPTASTRRSSPGAFGVRKLYAFLMAKAMEAIGKEVWPKVECSDTVRWSVYPDGTIYLLNTEMHLVQEAVVQRAADAPRVTLKLKPGEVAEVAD